jgi:hypothetical protein
VSTLYLLAGSALVAGAVGFSGGWKLRDVGARADLNAEKAERSDEKAKAATVTAEWQGIARKAEQKARDTENTWLSVARAIDQDGATHAEKLRTAVGRADAAVVGLRAQLGAVVADSARAAEAGASAADAAIRQAAAETARVSAGLLDACHTAGIARAGYAVAAGAAGERCERWATTIGATGDQKEPQ